MLAVHSITFLQPDEDFAQRLPGGGTDLAMYVAAIEQELRAHYGTIEAPGLRGLFIAVGPRSKHQFWLTGESLMPDESAAVEALASSIEPPQVQIGPISFVYLYTIGPASQAELEAEPHEQLRVPEAWRTVVESARQNLTADEIIAKLWSDR